MFQYDKLNAFGQSMVDSLRDEDGLTDKEIEPLIEDDWRIKNPYAFEGDENPDAGSADFEEDSDSGGNDSRGDSADPEKKDVGQAVVEPKIEPKPEPKPEVKPEEKPYEGHDPGLRPLSYPTMD